ncbi:MAG: MATE family efflux transporter [Ruminococcaceae bacterium]|nr:MATE family efflux transporter [Oscillospiraceae bacterium]
MKISLSDHFNVKRLLRFTLPSIIMMIVSSIYGVVDGFFVSNFAGKTPFAAVNFIMPFLMILGTVGFMFGTGGSALVAKTFGEGDSDRARRIFSLLIYVSIILGVVIAAFGIAFIRPVAYMLGARGELLDNCIIYSRVVLLGLPAFILQMEFQSFFVTAEKPNLGLYVTVGAGVTNMVLDWLFVGVFAWGLVGAAAATALSQMVGGFLPLLYFARKNTSILKLGKTHFDGKALLKTCTNGSSEFMSNISMSLVGMLYNIQLLNYAGEDGVAAYGVLMYVSMIFCGVFIGYSIGSAPVVGYHYGAGNREELKGLLKRSVGIISVFSVLMVGLSFLLSSPLSSLFVGYDKELLELTQQGFNIFSLSFLFMGMAIFGSGFFTALNDGLTSAAISFLRTLVFQIAAVLIFPLLWGIDGIWWSIVTAELAAVAVFVIFLFAKKNKYHYM